MKNYRPVISFLVFLLFTINNTIAGVDPKAKTLQLLREKFAKERFGFVPLNGKNINVANYVNLDPNNTLEIIGKLHPEGYFQDLDNEEKFAKQVFLKAENGSKLDRANLFLYNSLNRLLLIAETKRGKKYVESENKSLFKAIIKYGNIDVSRPNNKYRFHPSCFFVPTIAVNIYFSFYPVMQAVENGSNKDSLTVAVHKLLLQMGYQAWSQPYRFDSTDNNVVSVERFRNHVWWVGGNALSYRPLLPVAAMMSNIKMLDVLSEVAQKGISTVSQTTYEEAFWNEGITEDGAGWGHGTQCLIFGYPIDGNIAALNALLQFKNTPFEKELSRENVDALLNYIRGSSFYEYRGIVPPQFDRSNGTQKPLNRTASRTISLVDLLLNNFASSLKSTEIEELQRYQFEAKSIQLFMLDYPKGYYYGSRYFFNNDNLVKKVPSYYVFVDMASSRCYGIESAWPNNNGFNYYLNDGATLFQRNGAEYSQALGAMQLSSYPGITSRNIANNQLKPTVNWRGFNSSVNFAGAATSNDENFVTGFIFNKKNADDTNPLDSQHAQILGVKAYKSTFMFNDVFVGLGAGISNINSYVNGDIITTLDQTIKMPDFSITNNPITFQKRTSQGNVLVNDTIKWVTNNGFVYGVLPYATTGDVKIIQEQRKTTWKQLSQANDLPEKEVNIFQMYVNHGQHVNEGKYAYIVSCDGQIPSQIPIILKNDTTLQAAMSVDKTVIGATFYSANVTLKASEFWYKVSVPVNFLLEERSGQIYVTLCDPTMNNNIKEIVITTNRPLKGEAVEKVNDIYQISVAMPQKKLCGKPTTIKLLKAKD